MSTIAPVTEPGLRRALGLPGAVALGVGGTIGGGIYVLVGRAVGEAGPGALVSFAAAFAAALLIALPYAEMASRYPVAGGGYAFARAVFGERLGFLMGWGFWGAYLFISGYVTLGFGGYLHALTGVPVLAGALSLIAASLAVNLAGVRVSGTAQAIVVSVAIAGLVAFTVCGVSSVHAHNFHPLLPHGPGGVLTASLAAFLAFGGFDMIAAAGEEIRSPAHNLPRAILITLAAVLVLYLLVCFVVVGALGSATAGRSGAPLSVAAQRVGGVPLRQALTVVALLTTAATANAVLTVTSRISFAMARDGLLPRTLAAVGARSQAPWATLLLSGWLLCVVAAIGSISLAAAAGGFLYVAHFLVPLFAVFALRFRGERPGPTAARTPAPRITLPLALLGCTALLAASGWSGAAGGITWLALGGLAYGALRRTRSTYA